LRQPKQLRALWKRPVDIKPLNGLEKTLVSYAWQHLDGEFIVNRLVQKVAEYSNVALG